MKQGIIICKIFIKLKQDGKYRQILNLSRLNEHVDKITFKMETLRSSLKMIQAGCFLGEIDLTGAFYSDLNQG